MPSQSLSPGDLEIRNFIDGEFREAIAGKTLDNGEVKPVDVKVGDKVIFGQYGGSTVKLDGEELLILNESEIFGVLEG